MCWELERGIRGIRCALQTKTGAISGEESVHRTAQSVAFQSSSMSIRLCQLEWKWFSIYTEFLLIFFMILPYGANHGPFQVAQLYWLPIFNIAIYITLSRARKLPSNTVNSQVVFDLLESLSLGKYIQQTFSREWVQSLILQTFFPFVKQTHRLMLGLQQFFPW